MKRFMTEVRVFKKGNPVQCSVSMYISAGVMAFENTDRVKTDRKGVARIPHAREGKAKIYIDGQHKETKYVPAEMTIYLDYT